MAKPTVPNKDNSLEPNPTLYDVALLEEKVKVSEKLPSNASPKEEDQSAPHEEYHDIFTRCTTFSEPDYVRSLGLYPYFRSIEGIDGHQVICNGRRKIMIGSNNYLGLAHDRRVIEAGEEALRRYGSGCTGSRFLNGTLKLHEELEDSLSRYLDREATLLFSTGFFVNQGVITCLLDQGDFILCDRENHASIIDGCKMTPAKTVPFSHNSSEALLRRLARLPKKSGKLLIVDGVFSMSGDLIDLPAMLKVAKEYGCRIYVDEAHSLGVFGPKGQGVTHHFGLNKEVDLVMGTFSKSLGAMGGFVSGPKYVIDYLKHKTRCFIFTAALAPAVTGSVLKALKIIKSEPELREKLWKNTKKMHEGFKAIGFNIGTTESPIVPILVGSEIKAFQLCQKLFEAGIFTTPAVFPAVRYGKAIVRTSYMSSHTDQELDYVLETFEKLGKSLNVFSDPVYTGEKLKGAINGYNLTMHNHENDEAVRKSPGDSPQDRSEFYPTVSR